MSERRCEGCAVPISKDDTDFCVVCDHVRAAHLVQIEDLKKQAKSLRSDNERLKRALRVLHSSGNDLAAIVFKLSLLRGRHYEVTEKRADFADRHSRAWDDAAAHALTALALVGEE